MTQLYTDAWALGGSGNGYTHVKSGTTTLNSRIDYWFSELAAPIALTSVAVAGQVADSDHLAVVATYAIESTAGTGARRPWFRP